MNQATTCGTYDDIQDTLYAFSVLERWLVLWTDRSFDAGLLGVGNKLVLAAGWQQLYFHVD